MASYISNVITINEGGGGGALDLNIYALIILVFLDFWSIEGRRSFLLLL